MRSLRAWGRARRRCRGSALSAQRSAWSIVWSRYTACRIIMMAVTVTCQGPVSNTYMYKTAQSPYNWFINNLRLSTSPQYHSSLDRIPNLLLFPWQDSDILSILKTFDRISLDLTPIEYSCPPYIRANEPTLALKDSILFNSGLHRDGQQPRYYLVYDPGRKIIERRRMRITENLAGNVPVATDHDPGHLYPEPRSLIFSKSRIPTEFDNLGSRSEDLYPVSRQISGWCYIWGFKCRLCAPTILAMRSVFVLHL